jgi:hypothetical protein
MMLKYVKFVSINLTQLESVLTLQCVLVYFSDENGPGIYFYILSMGNQNSMGLLNTPSCRVKLLSRL